MEWDKIDPGAWANAILLLIGGLLAHFGIGQVRKAKDQRKQTPAEETLEIAGAIVSDKAVQKMVGSMDALSEAIHTDVKVKQAMTEALKENSKALDKNSETAEDMLSGVKTTSNQIERLREEIIRGIKS